MPEHTKSRFYTRAELRNAYETTGVAPGRTIYVTGNFGKPGLPSETGSTPLLEKARIADLHLEVLLDLIGEQGNLVVPTHSWGMVRSGETFDPANTPADYAFSEHVRKTLKPKRQFHPFASVAAFGPDADEIIRTGIHRHPYGSGSPFEKMAKLDALHVSIGIPARKSVSAVHHCEMVAGVPYRYTKAFQQEFLMDGEAQLQEFLLYVTYLESDLERDSNQKLTALPKIAKTVKQAPLGQSIVESLPLGTFVPEAIKAMQDDPYIWLAKPPTIRPWET